MTTVCSDTCRFINPVLSIRTVITTRPKLPESLIRGEFTSSSCKTAGLAMGPYFLFITANRRRADSNKSFSATIDQRRAICLSFLIGDINVALCLLKSAVTENVETGRVREFVQRWRSRNAAKHKLNFPFFWILLSRLIWPGSLESSRLSSVHTHGDETLDIIKRVWFCQISTAGTIRFIAVIARGSSKC